MITANARAMAGPTAPFSTITIERRDVGPSDVLIDIACSGLCHTDVHHARAEFGHTHYPIVPGHEIAGVVREVGAKSPASPPVTVSGWGASSTRAGSARAAAPARSPTAARARC